MNDAALVRRAMVLAARGRGSVEPNPMVGCVMVREGRVIGEGWHERNGGPHAEPNALRACAAAGETTEGATAYVTLEPCCHTNKRTPPCVPALVGAGVRRVVLGCLDPNPDVAGKGVGQLRAAGVEVTTGVLEGECRQMNAAFFARMDFGRPYVTAKWAESADGKVAGAGGKRLAITGEAANGVVHRLRARSDAILVGVGTVLADDPLLTARGVQGARPLIRAVVDSGLRMPVTSRLVRGASGGSMVVYCGNGAEDARARELEGAGVEVVRVGMTEGGLRLGEVVRDLGKREVSHLMVEAGPGLARGMFAAGVADRVWVFRSPKVVGEESAPAAVGVGSGFGEVGRAMVGEDELKEYLNLGSEVYFAGEPSVDFVQLGAGG